MVIAPNDRFIVGDEWAVSLEPMYLQFRVQPGASELLQRHPAFWTALQQELESDNAWSRCFIDQIGGDIYIYPAGIDTGIIVQEADFERNGTIQAIGHDFRERARRAAHTV
jgi:hypothetical protein